jgi:type II secretory ATPase GspE/PulE/Tfp pilus assembly ATPase PilB-like protein
MKFVRDEITRKGKKKLKSEGLENFRLFPVKFVPGFLGRLKGLSSFSLDDDHLFIQKYSKSEKIDFDNIDQVDSNKNRVSIVLNSGRSLRLKIDKKPELVAELIKRLIEELKAWRNFKIKIETFDENERFAFFQKCFSFKAKPFVWATEALLQISSLQNISDIHFEPSKDCVRISWRNLGKVKTPGTLNFDSYKGLAARLKYLGGCRSHICDQAQEGAFHDTSTDQDVRVSTFPADFGERLSLRFIQPLRYKSITELGWKGSVAEKWRERLKHGSGLFVICGAVGSGKTTALYATLSHLAGENNNLRVVTLEDPVEGRVPGICQSSLDSMKGSSLSVAFKHLLRQDPDVIALGEIRDRECLIQALQAGLSGHLVLATFHAGGIEDATERIKQMGIEDYLVFSGLKGILYLELKHQVNKANASANFVVPKVGNI